MMTIIWFYSNLFFGFFLKIKKFLFVKWNNGQTNLNSNNLNHQLHPDLKVWQSVFCGALAGTVAGAITTPLDVAKTRIMLAEVNIIWPLYF